MPSIDVLLRGEERKKKTSACLGDNTKTGNMSRSSWLVGKEVTLV